jgi:hypothetical protein
MIWLTDCHIAWAGNYTPPDCKFNRVVVNFTVVSEGRQYDRLAMMSLGDYEVWRTSTAEPTAAPGIAWTYWKDLTPFLALWEKPQTLIFNLPNIYDSTYTGILNSTLTATFFYDDDADLAGGGPAGVAPADVILPVSARLGSQGQDSSWSYSQGSPGANTSLTLPRNANRAVFVVAANGQQDEEFWWTNVPQSGADVFGGGADALYGLGSFREVRARIDGHIVGFVYPFPVIFTGGVSPALHRPLVGLQAFDLRESEIDISPWLGYLSDGKSHLFSLEVMGVNDTGSYAVFEAPPEYWVLDGKIHLWLDAEGHVTTGAPPKVDISPLNYVSHNVIQQNVSLTYKQYVTRSITASSRIKTQRGTFDSVWKQDFSMTNNGVVNEGGNYQSLEAEYTGADSAIKDGEIYEYTAYSYPADLESQYYGPTSQWDFALQAALYQGLDRTVTGSSVLTTELAPWISDLPRDVSGSSLSTYRNGSAFLYEYDDETKSVGYGTMKQQYRLGARLESDGCTSNYIARPLLYERDVTVVNATVTADKEYTWNAGWPGKQTSRPPQAPGSAGAFAPMPGKQHGLPNLGHATGMDVNLDVNLRRGAGVNRAALGKIGGPRQPRQPRRRMMGPKRRWNTTP